MLVPPVRTKIFKTEYSYVFIQDWAMLIHVLQMTAVHSIFWNYFAKRIYPYPHLILNRIWDPYKVSGKLYVYKISRKKLDSTL